MQGDIIIVIIVRITIIIVVIVITYIYIYIYIRYFGGARKAREAPEGINIVGQAMAVAIRTCACSICVVFSTS